MKCKQEKTDILWCRETKRKKRGKGRIWMKVVLILWNGVDVFTCIKVKVHFWMKGLKWMAERMKWYNCVCARACACVHMHPYGGDSWMLHPLNTNNGRIMGKTVDHSEWMKFREKIFNKMTWMDDWEKDSIV